MAKLTFKDLTFEQEKDKVKVNLLKLFYFYIDNEELNKIGKYKLKDNEIEFTGQESADKKFNFLISKNITKLKSKLQNKDAVYIHSNSGIPLIGNISFGLVDRGTSCIEVKPVTGCNLNCIYCSVDEGKDSKKTTDFVVEKDYLMQEFRKLAEFKEFDIEAHIGTHGEPLLYANITELISDLSKIKNVKIISIDTNGTLLTKENIDKMADAGLTRINLSLNAVSPKTAEKIAGTKINTEHVKEMAKYALTKCDLTIAPIYLPGINEKEIENILLFAKELEKIKTKHKLIVGIQNFLRYKGGRNPTKQLNWNAFTERLKQLEKEYGIKLVLNLAEDFGIVKAKELQKPFKKGDIVKARIVCNGRNKNEKIAVAQERTISIPNCFKEGEAKVKIIRSKHNIFVGKVM
ncbi:radical SAM protein [Candidatus Woesearchaeota archaeon]|nr:radical SAM protein [Candidatus Woesearchaeota archaeon]